MKAWLQKNAETLNLQITQFAWTQPWDFPGTDLRATIEIQGRTFIGRGTALNQDLAFIKAGAEAIERAACADYEIHSTGVAVHTDASLAQGAARFELIERESFFWHFYLKSPFHPLIDSELSRFRDRYRSTLSRVSAELIELRFYRSRFSQTPVICCIATGERCASPWGGIIGLSARANETDAIESAFFECLRNVAAAVFSPIDELTAEDFKKRARPTSQDRQRLARNLAYWKEISFLFPKDASRAISVKEPNFKMTDEVSLERLELRAVPIKSAPLYAYRAIPPQSSGAFIGTDGNPGADFFTKLSTLAGHAEVKNETHFLPHFLG